MLSYISMNMCLNRNIVEEDSWRDLLHEMFLKEF